MAGRATAKSSENTALISSAEPQHGCVSVPWNCYQGSWHSSGSVQLPLSHNSKLYFRDSDRKRIVPKKKIV